MQGHNFVQDRQIYSEWLLDHALPSSLTDIRDWLTLPTWKAWLLCPKRIATCARKIIHGLGMEELATSARIDG